MASVGANAMRLMEAPAGGASALALTRGAVLTGSPSGEGDVAWTCTAGLAMGAEPWSLAPQLYEVRTSEAKSGP